MKISTFIQLYVLLEILLWSVTGYTTPEPSLPTKTVEQLRTLGITDPASLSQEQLDSNVMPIAQQPSSDSEKTPSANNNVSSTKPVNNNMPGVKPASSDPTLPIQNAASKGNKSSGLTTWIPGKSTDVVEKELEVVDQKQQLAKDNDLKEKEKNFHLDYENFSELGMLDKKDWGIDNGHIPRFVSLNNYKNWAIVSAKNGDLDALRANLAIIDKAGDSSRDFYNLLVDNCADPVVKNWLLAKDTHKVQTIMRPSPW
jgi:hypothetical protein